MGMETLIIQFTNNYNLDNYLQLNQYNGSLFFIFSDLDYSDKLPHLLQNQKESIIVTVNNLAHYMNYVTFKFSQRLHLIILHIKF